MTTTIPSMLASILEARKVATMDLSTWDDPRTYAGASMMKAQAQTTLLTAIPDFKRLVVENSGAVFATGPGAATFAEIAAEEGPAIVLDAEGVYKEIAQITAEGVPANGEFKVDTHMRFLDGLRVVCQNLGITQFPAVDLSPYAATPLHVPGAVLAMVRGAITKAVGDELAVIYLHDKLAQQVIETEYDKPHVFVVVLNATPEEIEGNLGKTLCQGHTISITAKESTDKNDVLVAYHRLYPDTKTTKTNKAKAAK